MSDRLSKSIDLDTLNTPGVYTVRNTTPNMQHWPEPEYIGSIETDGKPGGQRTATKQFPDGRFEVWHRPAGGEYTKTVTYTRDVILYQDYVPAPPVDLGFVRYHRSTGMHREVYRGYQRRLDAVFGWERWKKFPSWMLGVFRDRSSEDLA